MTSEIDYTGKIVQFLRNSAFEVKQNVFVGSSSPDVYAVAPSGSSVIVDVKLWKPTPSNIERASHLAELHRQASGAERAFIVIPTLTKDYPKRGVVSFNFVASRPASLFSITTIHPPPAVAPRPSTKVFAAMPFAPLYDDTFVLGMKPACRSNGAECHRIDHISFTGDIVTEIKRQILASSAAIVDLSDSRPNVLYEMGLAEANGKPIIQICSTPIAQLPFDVRNNRTIQYQIGQVSKLIPRLETELQTVLP